MICQFTNNILLELAWTKEVLHGLAQGQRKSYLDWHKNNGSLTWTGTRTKEVLLGLAQGQGSVTWIGPMTNEVLLVLAQ